MYSVYLVISTKVKKIVLGYRYKSTAHFSTCKINLYVLKHILVFEKIDVSYRSIVSMISGLINSVLMMWLPEVNPRFLSEVNSNKYPYILFLVLVSAYYYSCTGISVPKNN